MCLCFISSFIDDGQLHYVFLEQATIDYNQLITLILN